MRRTVGPLYLFMVAAITLAACQPGEEPPTSPTTDATPQETAATAAPTSTATPTERTTDGDATAGWVRCDNDADGFSVEHPPDWETNQGDVLPACSLFDPGDIEVERGTQIPFDIAATFRVEPVALDRIADGEPSEEELSHEGASVDGRDAVRREVESSGEALRPAGMRSTFWLVAVADDETLIAGTHDVGELDYRNKQQTLDLMIESLELDAR